MRLTRRGRGLVAGLIIATVGVLGYTYNEGTYKMEGGEPVKVEQAHIEEDEEGWDCTTMGNEYCGTDFMPGGATNWDMDTASDMPMTNPCPYAMHIALECDGGF